MTVTQIINQAKQSIESLLGAEVSIQYKANYGSEKIELLKNAVCKAYGIAAYDLVKKRRVKELVRPRQMFYYFALEKYYIGVKEAGDMFGQDHTTAIHGRDKVKDLLSIMDEETHDKVELINEYLNN